MANERGKSIDNTHLSIDTAEERRLIHRDYIAHVLRWTHVAKVLGTSGRYGSTRVLDVGCGIDIPLARMLYANRFIVPDYVGLDYNKSAKFKTEMFSNGKFPLAAYGGVDFASKQVRLRSPEFGELTKSVVLFVDGDTEEGEHELPNVITSFEVLEHVEPSHARAMLRKMRLILDKSQELYGVEGIAFISTPCYDPTVGAAANHVNEMKREALGALIEDLDFEIVENYGTFASIRDYRDNMLAEMPEIRKVWERLHGYYDTNMLANVFAPMFPQYARNNLWVLRPTKEGRAYTRKFPALAEVKGPWTSSQLWEQLSSDDNYKMEI